MKVFFVRCGGQKDWKMMVTTDTSLSFVEMMRTYHIRWCIEVFFKETKQYLDLGGCQSRDLDAQIRDASIAMIQYVMLSLSKRFDEYETLGGMFREHQKEAFLWTLAERLWGLLQEILLEICEEKGIYPEELLEKLMSGHCPKLEKMVAIWDQEEDIGQWQKAA